MTPARLPELPAWPAMMRKTLAAAYLDLSIAAFEREVATGRLPQPSILGGRERWAKAALDNAIAGAENTSPAEQEFWKRYG